MAQRSFKLHFRLSTKLYGGTRRNLKLHFRFQIFLKAPRNTKTLWWHNHTSRWSEHNPPNPTKLLCRHVWRPIPYSLQAMIVDDLTNLAHIRHCTWRQGTSKKKKKRWSLQYRTIGNEVYVSIALRPPLHACNFNPIIRPGRQTS